MIVFKKISLTVLASMLSVLCMAQGVPVKGGATTDLANVNASKALEIAVGKSTRPTFIASSGALVTTAAYSLSIEAGPSLGIKVTRICVGVSNATAAAGVTVTVQRRSTASSGGTALTAEGTGADAVSKLDPGDSNFSGVARRTGTLGTAGPVLDQWGFMVGEVGAGTADVPSLPLQCVAYGGPTGEKPIVVQAGTANGISINVSAPGAGGLAFGSISATFISE